MVEKYKEKYVIFIDILGFKALVDDENKSSDSIGEILNYFSSNNLKKTIQNRLPSKPIADEEINYNDLKITSFSDCLVISFFDESNPTMSPYMAYYLLEAISLISLILIRDHGVHLRGGMVLGKIYHSDLKVYGPALNKAYEIESRYSEFPRVLIENLELPCIKALGFEEIHKLITKVEVKGSKFLQLHIGNSISYIISTRYKFNEYINSFQSENNLSTDNDLKTIKIACNNLLTEIEKDPSFEDNKVRGKHKWIVDKLNSLDL